MFLPNFQIFAALKKGEILYSCHVAEFFFWTVRCLETCSSVYIFSIVTITKEKLEK